jgi:NAD(P)-dependent dehydrogenase (short-subunit alcohol dehydrogenase family)
MCEKQHSRTANTHTMVSAPAGSRLIGRLAVVTGASGTIGKAIAAALYEHGMSVVLVGRSLDKLRAAQQEIKQAPALSSNVVDFVSCDVTSTTDVRDLFATIDERFPQNPLHLLVNNAGININGTTFDIDGTDFQKVLNVNVVGPFLCSQQAFRRMMKKSSTAEGGGRIINVGSISAQAPRPDTAAYTASKFALNGLTRSLALDGRPYNIAVGIIQPGNVLSDLLTEQQKEDRGKHEGFMSPQDVANSVLYMASLPLQTNVLELTVLPTTQPLVGRG